MTEPGQPKRFGDIRDDYDDEFTKVVTPRDRARRRLMIPAIGIIFTGVLGIGGMMAAAIGLAVEFFDHPIYTEEAIVFSFLLALVATAAYLFFFVVWGGISLIRLRRYRMALFAAFFVTALSVGGFYSLLFFPFGVSALILLFGTNARKEFEGYVVPTTASPVTVEGATRTSAYGDVRDDFDDEFGQTVPPDVAIRRKVRVPAYGMMTAGVLGVLAMLIVTGYMMVDFATSNKYRDEGDVIAVLCLTSPGTAFAAIMFFGGWCLLKQKRYVWAVVGAFFVTSLACSGVMAVLFYPFGFWALVLLYRDDVRKAFGLPVARQPRAINKNAIPAREMVSKVAGAMGLCVIVFGVVLTLDSFFAGELTGEEAVIATTVLGLGTIGFAGLFAYGFYLSRKRRAEPAAARERLSKNRIGMTRMLDFKKAGGLVPAIAQDADTGEVLMLAWMNAEAFEETSRTGRACYYSRSRGKLWRKGEESGHVQEVRGIYVDCDADTVLLKVKQVGGAACHEGYSSCFFRKVEGAELRVIAERVFDPKTVYKK